MQPKEEVQLQLEQANEHHGNYHLNWRWRIISCALLLQGIVLTLVVVILRMPGTTLPESLSDHIVTTLLAGFFSLIGTIIFLRINALLAASVAYGVFVCGSLICCLLNIGSSPGSVIAMSLLSVVAYGLAATFASQFAFPDGWHIGRLRITPYSPFFCSLALCIISLPVFFLFPMQWLVTTLLIYAFPLASMLIIIWSIFFGLRRASASNRALDGTAFICIMFVLLSLSMINGKSTPYHITYLPSTIGFLIFYAFCIASFTICTGMIFWIWHRLLLYLLRIVVPIVCIALGVSLMGGILHFPTSNLNFLRTSLANLFVYHTLSIPLFVLPVFSCYVLLYHQLSGHVGVLRRSFIRGTLWFLLASCCVVSELVASVLAVQNWDNHSEITLICIIWLFLVCWLFPLFWSNIRDIGDRMFYRDFYHYNRTLRDLSRELPMLHNMRAICDFLLPRLTELLNASVVVLLVRKDAEEVLSHWQCYQYEVEPACIRAEHFKMIAQQAATRFSRLNDKPQLVNGILVLPLYDASQLRGCLCLGEKLNGELYSRQDKSFLETLAAQLAVLESNVHYLDQVYAYTQQVTALNHRIIQTQEEERRRLALELHDDVLQQAMLLTRQLTDLNDDPRIARSLSLAQSISRGLRTTCLELRPPLLDELGLPEALRWLVQQAEQQSNIQIKFQLCTVTAQPQRLPDAVEVALYRVAQESLTNAMKHANASLICVRLHVNREGLVSLLISDNGCGLQRSRPLTDSLGLAGMIDRMQAIGGKLQMRSSQGQGVVIRALYHGPSDLPMGSVGAVSNQ